MKFLTPFPVKPFKTTLNTFLFQLNFLFRDVYFHSISVYITHQVLYRNIKKKRGNHYFMSMNY